MRGGRVKSRWVVSWTTSGLSVSTPTVLVDDCSPGRGGMAQDGGTFHGEIDLCRESQGWATACSGMPERDGNNH